MPDPFEDRSAGLESPAYHATSVVPNDTTDLPMTSRALYVGGAGDLRVTMAGGETLSFRNAAAGLLPVRVARVHATGTNATDIVALW